MFLSTHPTREERPTPVGPCPQARRGRYSSWLLALGLLASLGSARAEPDTHAVLALELNHTSRGAIFPLLRAEDVLVPVEELRQADVDVRALGGQRETIDGKEYVSLRSLAPTVRYTLDEQTAKLRLTVPPGLLPLTRVDLRTQVRPAELQLSQDSSAFVNYAAQVRGDRLTFSTEAVAGTGPLLLSSTAFWNMGSRPVRGLSQLALDRPEALLRVVMGDGQANGGLLGGGGVLGGLHLSRNFELDPYFVRTPAFNFAGSVAAPSTVDVYVNGSRVRRVDLPPGPFDLTNLPLNQGLAGTRYVLRDAFGREREVAAEQYVASGLLASGLSAFNVSLGVQREDLATQSFHYTRPALLGVYRRGLKPWLTGGVRLEAARNLVSGGSMLSLGLPVGEFELIAAGSLDEGHAGAAASAAYVYQDRKVGLQAFVRAMSASYATLSQTAQVNRPLLSTGAHASVSLSQSFRVGGEFSAWRFRDSGTALRGSLNGALRVNARASLLVTALAGTSTSGGPEYATLVGLNLVLGEHTTGGLSGRHDLNGPGASLDISQSLPQESGFGYRLRGEAGAQPRGEASVESQGPIGRYSAGVEYAAGAAVARASVSGSLVVMDGRVMLARPIEQGFALVRAPGLAGARILLNNHVVAQTDGDGTALIPNLTPYYANRLALHDQDIPDDFGVPDLARLVAPHVRRGATVRFETRRIRPIRGRLSLDGVDASRLALGDLLLLGHDAQGSPIGTQGEFELEGLAPGSYTARVTYAGGECLAQLEIPPSEEKLINLDVVPCLARPPQEPR